MGKYRMCEPYGYQEGMGYVSNANSNGNAKAIVDDEIAKLIDGAPEAFNTLKEISDYIEKDEKGMSKMMSDINKNKSDITALKAKDNELQAAVNSKASQSELNALKGNVYTKAESDSKYATEEWVNEQGFVTDSQLGDEYATKEWVGEQGFITDGQLSEDYATKEWVNEQGFLTEHQDISNLATKEEVEEVSSAVTAEIAAVAATIPTVPTNVSEFENDANYTTEQWIDEQGFLTEHQSLSGYATEAWVSEQGFLTEHQDISNLATKNEVESGLTDLWTSLNLAAEKIDTKADADVVYTKDEVDAMLAEKQTEIDKIISDYKKLKEIVGDLGGAVEYSVPADGKLIDMLKKSGIIKLTEDVESNTYTGGITSKNITTLNLNGKTVTTTANTTTNPSIMVRGTQQFTIQGSGTLNANGHIAIEANGENAVITLGGTAFGRPTYITNREGELIYCYLGTINITNGVFRNDNENKKFLLNCYDANYQNGTAKIVVTGGKFYDFDPANNASEGEGTSYVPEGYVSVESTETIDGVEHTVYTVKKA